MFVNREKELASLKRCIRGGKGEFIVVYGRRRVGKTELLKNLSADIYFLGRYESVRDQLKRFYRVFKEASIRKGVQYPLRPFRDWDEAFEYLSHSDFTVVFDEFPYMIESYPPLQSILQDWWDNKLRHGSIKIIICGSSMGMMERIIGYKSPLYGRRTMQLKVLPLSFVDSTRFLKGTMAEKIKIYGAVGGTPAYLLEAGNGFWRTIKEKFLVPTEVLSKDAYFILREELKEPRYYFSILKALSFGKGRVGEIMNETGLTKDIVSKYLGVLQDLGFVKHELPFSLHGRRRGLWKIADNYFRFWFRYIYPSLEYIEMDMADNIVYEIKRTYSEYMGSVFEDLVGELLRQRYPLVSRWWYKGEEIDLVAVDRTKKEVVFAEVKWRGRKMGWKEYRELVRKSELVDVHDHYRKRYMLVNKGGFKDTEKMRAEGVELWDLKTIEGITTGKK